MLRVELLGGFQIRDEAGALVECPAGKPAALFAYLLLEPHSTSRDELARMLWPGVPRERGLQSVRQALSTLRHALGESVIATADRLQADRTEVTCDVHDLRAALENQDLATAERLWTGPLLDRFMLSGVPLWDRWLEQQRSELEQQYSDTLRMAASALVRAGDFHQACALLQRETSLQPWSLPARLMWIDALIDCAQQREAATALAQARRDFPEPEFQGELALRQTRLQRLERDECDPLVRTELVGRVHELGVLASLWLAARQGTTARVVLAGAPGIGKSRLTEELCRIAERDGGRVVRVLAAETDQELEWAGVASLARQLLRLPGAAGASAASESILRRLVPSLAQSAHQSDARLPEGGIVGEALADMIAAIAWEAPLVVVMDDVRWLDARSWAVLRRLAASISDEPVLFLLALRTDAADASGAAALLRVTRTLGSHTFVRIPPFTPDETTEFLVTNGGLAGDVADRLRDPIHALARGIPLFAAEIVRYLRQEGRIVPHGGGWRWQGALEPLELPASMPALFEARLRGLPDAAERVLEELSRGRLATGELERVAGLDSAALNHVFGVLEDAGLLRTVGAGHQVAHDVLASLVRARAQASREREGLTRRWGLVAATGLLLLATALLAAWTVAPRQYGGGEVLVLDEGEYLTYTPPRWPLKNWSVRRAGSAGATSRYYLHPPVTTTAGEKVQLVSVRYPDASPYAAELVDGRVQTLLRLDTDSEPQGVTPDGQYVAVLRDDPATPARYDLGVVLHDRRTARQELVYQATGNANVGMNWSDDGFLTGLVVQAGRDTLVMLTRDGHVVRRFVADQLGAYEWCTTRTFAASVQEAGAFGLLLGKLSGRDTLVTDVGAVLSNSVSCSPDGSAVAFLGLNDGRVRYRLYETRNGRVTDLPIPPRARVFQWVPPRRRVVPVRAEYRAPRSLLVGRRIDLAPRLVFSDSSRHSALLSLRSSDPRILAVEGTQVIGNRVGTAMVRVLFDGIPLDSAAIRVAPPEPARLVLSDRFASLQQWTVIGDSRRPDDPTRRRPPVALVREGGEGTLMLLGDHNYADGVGSRATFDLHRGFQVELEFRFPLTRSDRQQLHIGLSTGPFERDSAGIVQIPPVAEFLSFSYPARTGSKFRREEASLWAFGAAGTVLVDPVIGAGAWHRLRLVVRPDGYAEIWLDGRLAAESLARAESLSARMHLLIMGSAVGTELAVRRVEVWEGLRG